MVGAVGGSFSYYPVYNHYLNKDNMKVPPVTALNKNEQQAEKTSKTGKTECQTCKERKYVDGSNESNVSFKTPGHVSPESSMAMVSAHEQEHVKNAVSEGSKPGADLISASVKLSMAVCPECGRSYVAGGVTTTQIKYSNEKNPYQQERKKVDELLLKGMNFDSAA